MWGGGGVTGIIVQNTVYFFTVNFELDLSHLESFVHVTSLEFASGPK